LAVCGFKGECVPCGAGFPRLELQDESTAGKDAVLRGRVGIPGIELADFSTKSEERDVSAYIHAGARPKCSARSGGITKAALGREVPESPTK